jgi:hypothetical protein
MTDDQMMIEVPAGRFAARPYRPDDEERVLELWRIAFGKELPVEIWRWKYARNPFGSRILLCLDDNGDAAVVMYSGVPFRTNWNGREVEMVQLMDIMSHPDYRKTGLFVKTAEAFFDRFAGGESVLYYGIPGLYHFEIGAKYLAYSRLDSDVAYFSADPATLASGGRGRLREEGMPGAAFDALWNELAGHYPLAVVRNSAFLRWRFFDHPHRRYTVYGWRTGLLGRLRAWAVVGIEDDSARIADLLLPPDPALSAGFLGSVAGAVSTKGVQRLETWVPGGHFAVDGLRTAGFEQTAEPLGIVPTARSFDDNLEISWVSDNLYYTMADADLV